MAMMTKKFFVLTILAIVYIGVHGELIEEHPERSSYLWRVNSSPPSYLFGTVHVPYTLVWDSVSKDAKTAFNSANQVYLETLSDPLTLKAAKSCSLLPQGQNISQV